MPYPSPCSVCTRTGISCCCSVLAIRGRVETQVKRHACCHFHCGERTAYEYGQVQVQAGEEPLTRSYGAVQVQALREKLDASMLGCMYSSELVLYGCMIVWSIGGRGCMEQSREEQKSPPSLASPRLAEYSTAQHSTANWIRWINVYVAVAVTLNVAAAGTQTLGISREQVRVPAVGKHTPLPSVCCPVCAQCKQPPVPSAHSAAYCSAPDPTRV
ncbi:hypothetical protein V8C43DRAFT_269681 [Trichoderma afarasin]